MKKNEEGRIVLELTKLDQKLVEMLKDIVNIYQRRIFKKLEESYPNGLVGEMQFTHGRIVEILGEAKKDLVLSRMNRKGEKIEFPIF